MEIPFINLELSVSDVIAMLALLVSVLSLYFSSKNLKSDQEIRKSEILVNVSEKLLMAKNELSEVINRLNEHKLLMGDERIEELKTLLSEVEDVQKTIVSAIDVGLSVEYKKLFILQAYAKNSFANFEWIKRTLLPDLEQLISKAERLKLQRESNSKNGGIKS